MPVRWARGSRQDRSGEPDDGRPQFGVSAREQPVLDEVQTPDEEVRDAEDEGVLPERVGTASEATSSGAIAASRTTRIVPSSLPAVFPSQAYAVQANQSTIRSATASTACVQVGS